MQEVVDRLIKNGETIATMESCTGGYLAASITDIEGSSNILKFSAVTYSNEYKIKMGISKDTIDKYSVYSEEVAKEMSYNISKYAGSTYGVGITGKFSNDDPANSRGSLNTIFVSIYNDGKYYTYQLHSTGTTRRENKQYIVDYIVERLKEIIKD